MAGQTLRNPPICITAYSLQRHLQEQLYKFVRHCSAVLYMCQKRPKVSDPWPGQVRFTAFPSSCAPDVKLRGRQLPISDILVVSQYLYTRSYSS